MIDQTGPDSASKTTTPAAPPKKASLPPEPPRSLDRLKWRPQPMVQWFDPVQLAGTGVRALLSSIFGAYADKREVQAALAADTRGEPIIHDYSAEDDLWIDYTADLGDGFDSTYTIAWLMGRDRIPTPPADGETPKAQARREELAATKRARILILGGDQVYPTATRAEYEQRFAGPYEAALPWVPDDQRPRIFAIPGNHDWYDGLTSFMRLICQSRWIGGWQTRQARSYFAMKLPRGWWLLGTDIQLQADIDKPQLDFFRKVAAKMKPGDRVILCTAEPAWVHAPHHPEVFDNLAYFERTVICPSGAELALTLTGDLHHYARYEDEDGRRHKITAGGGGAYLYGTHLLPEEVDLEAPGSGSGNDEPPARERFRRQSVYPPPAESRRIRRGAWRLPLLNGRFPVFLGIVYLTYAWALQFASSVGDASSLVAMARSSGPGDTLAIIQRVVASVIASPFLFAFSVIFIAAMWAFCQPDPGRPKWWKAFGAIHGLAHLVLIVALTWFFAWLDLAVITTNDLSTLTGLVVFSAVFAVQMIIVGGVLGGFLMGLALLPGVNFNEAYSAQRIEDFKCFVRLNITPEGTLRIHPIGVDRVARWEIDPEAKPGDPYFRTRDGSPPVARLIEDPIEIPAVPVKISVPSVYTDQK
jgi:hypothetical protein